MKPIARSTLPDVVADQLLALIRSGVCEKREPPLPPISHMAEGFDVTATTVRQALQKLAAVGVVDVRHRGYTCAPYTEERLIMPNRIFGGEVTKKLLLDLVEARMSIEVPASKAAATQASEYDLIQMAALLEEAEASQDDDSFSRANPAFHAAIATASGNGVVSQLQEAITSLFQREHRVMLRICRSRDQDHAEHRGLLEAIRGRDPKLAAERMHAYLTGVRQDIQRWTPCNERSVGTP